MASLMRTDVLSAEVPLGVWRDESRPPPADLEATPGAAAAAAASETMIDGSRGDTKVGLPRAVRDYVRMGDILV